MPLTRLLGKYRSSGPIAQLHSPDHFETIDAGDLDNDTADILARTVVPFVFRKVRVEGAGDLAILKRDGDITIIPGLAAGDTVVCVGVKIMDTDTTVAGGITVFY